MLVPWDPEGRSCCETCIRDALAKNGFTCPMTGAEGVSPDDLLPNAGVRKGAEAFVKDVMEKLDMIEGQIEKEQAEEEERRRKAAAEAEPPAGGEDGADAGDYEDAGDGIVGRRKAAKAAKRAKRGGADDDLFGGEDEFGGDVFAVEEPASDEDGGGTASADAADAAATTSTTTTTTEKKNDNVESTSLDNNTKAHSNGEGAKQSGGEDDCHADGDGGAAENGDEGGPTAPRSEPAASPATGRGREPPQKQRRGPPEGYVLGPAGGGGIPPPPPRGAGGDGGGGFQGRGGGGYPHGNAGPGFQGRGDWGHGGGRGGWNHHPGWGGRGPPGRGGYNHPVSQIMRLSSIRTCQVGSSRPRVVRMSKYYAKSTQKSFHQNFSVRALVRSLYRHRTTLHYLFVHTTFFNLPSPSISSCLADINFGLPIAKNTGRLGPQAKLRYHAGTRRMGWTPRRTGPLWGQRVRTPRGSGLRTPRPRLRAASGERFPWKGARPVLRLLQVRGVRTYRPELSSSKEGWEVSRWLLACLRISSPLGFLCHCCKVGVSDWRIGTR